MYNIKFLHNNSWRMSSFGYDHPTAMAMSAMIERHKGKGKINVTRITQMMGIRYDDID